LQRVKKVIGVEMCAEAVEDAKTNASLNGNSFISHQIHCKLLIMPLLMMTQLIFGKAKIKKFSAWLKDDVYVK